MKTVLSKEASIQKLKKVKLVLGNGFDLLCGIKSSYKDFFESRKAEFEHYIKDIEKRHSKFLDNLFFVQDDNVFDDVPNKELLNVWMAFFAIMSQETADYRWCDIETMMADSLSSRHIYGSWPTVYDLVKQNPYEEELEDSFPNMYLAAMCYYLNDNKPFNSETDFYEFLLNQLVVFETSFVKYIAKNHSNDLYQQFGVNHHNDVFTNNCKYVLNLLCNINEVVSIDTFNFDEVDDDKIDSLIKHVNGDMYHPIFGVDSNLFQADDPRFIFTKLCRRMNNDMNNQDGFSDSSFENAVIFGHSLSEHDYSYFFPLLDKLNVMNMELNNKIVFAFIIYDLEQKDSIIKNYRKAVFDLFKNYSTYKGTAKQTERFLDFLTTQGRIIMYQLQILPVKHDLDTNKYLFATKRIF